jgi:outer membrane lipoprotein-sorting protein
MRRRIAWIVTMVLCVTMILMGCGKKDAGSVVKDLDGVLKDLTSYQGAGAMTLHTGEQPLVYELEVWYQAPHYYRIALTNAKKDVTQIVLKNDDGVFVLTPSLNKSFRFQSDWPERRGQAYLYHTLVQSILQDNNRQFTEDGDAYVFEVASNLQNNSLTSQRVWLNKKNYAPIKMEALDREGSVLLDVAFESFTFEKKFDSDSFQMERNMTSYDIQTLPTLAQEDSLDLNQASGAGSFGILRPEYLPEGVVMKDMNDIQIGDEAGVLLRYEGTYSFSLTESRPKDRAVSAIPGTLLDLGFAVGILLGDDKQTLTWMNDGIEFRLSTADLPQDEMIKIAQSMVDQIGK